MFQNYNLLPGWRAQKPDSAWLAVSGSPFMEFSLREVGVFWGGALGSAVRGAVSWAVAFSANTPARMSEISSQTLTTNELQQYILAKYELLSGHARRDGIFVTFEVFLQSGTQRNIERCYACSDGDNYNYE